jgi:predicted alpha/beta-hydrolase family hydrolase
MKPVVLFAHGAGAPSSSAWMRRWRKRLAALGEVKAFDYPYMRAGRRRPDPHRVLVDAHIAAVDRAGERRVILAGKSMGGRIGCHVALDREVAAVVCLGYPLVSPAGKMRDEVLLALTTPILFVQGTRDPLCPLDTLERVRRRMQAENGLHVVESGDHSLQATKRWLAENGRTQSSVEAAALEAIVAFVSAHASTRVTATKDRRT